MAASCFMLQTVRHSPKSNRSSWARPRSGRVFRRGLQAAASGKADADGFEDFVLSTQRALCNTFASVEGNGSSFCEDRWERGGDAGYGLTRVLEGGSVLEKAACNVSVVRGSLSAQRAAAMSARGRGVDPAGGQPYSAVALSLVFHSGNPHLPTFRADVRRFEVAGVGAWFGGGADLTPFYLLDADAAAFHRHWRDVCGRHGPALYPAYKKWCDDYFKIPCRGEHRGVGGIFFDDLPDRQDPADLPGGSAVQASGGFPAGMGPDEAAVAAPPDAEAFTRDVAQSLAASYEPLCRARGRLPYTDAQRTWQLQRRGRYLEFNLLYDRGVRFGMDGGRFESVMVSAPPLIRWDYDVQPEAGSEEARLLEVLRSPRDWAGAPQ